MEDYNAIQNLIGKYQWLVDEGDSEGWAALFTEDGAFIGGLPNPVPGHKNLKSIPKGVKDNYHDKMRHTTGGSCFIEYGASTDDAVAKYYNLVATWMAEDGAQFFIDRPLRASQ